MTSHDHDRTEIMHVSVDRMIQMLLAWGVIGVGIGGLLFGDELTNLVGGIVLVGAIGYFVYNLWKAAEEDKELP